jgi:hypothetical protein
MLCERPEPAALEMLLFSDSSSFFLSFSFLAPGQEMEGKSWNRGNQKNCLEAVMGLSEKTDIKRRLLPGMFLAGLPNLRVHNMVV